MAPLAGRLVKLKPHAFVVIDGTAGPCSFTSASTPSRWAATASPSSRSEGQHVAAGDPVVRWDPLSVAQRGLSPVCPIVALGAPAEEIGDPASGQVALGGALFTWRDTRPPARSTGGTSRHRRSR